MSKALWTRKHLEEKLMSAHCANPDSRQRQSISTNTLLGDDSPQYHQPLLLKTEQAPCPNGAIEPVLELSCWYTAQYACVLVWLLKRGILRLAVFDDISYPQKTVSG